MFGRGWSHLFLQETAVILSLLHRQTGERVVAILGSLRGGLRSTPWASCPLAWQLKGGLVLNNEPQEGPDDQGSPEASEGG